MLRQELPGLPHLLQKRFHIGCNGALVLLVGLGEDKYKRDLPLPKAVDKIQIDLLRGMPTVYQHEYVGKVRTLAQVVFDHLLPFLPLSLRHLCKTITGKVDDVPFIVDVEMIDQLCFAGSTGGLGQLIVIADHVDQGGLADIASPDESILRPVGLGALCVIRTADDVDGGMDIHIALNKAVRYVPLPSYG